MFASIKNQKSAWKMYNPGIWNGRSLTDSRNGRFRRIASRLFWEGQGKSEKHRWWRSSASGASGIPHNNGFPIAVWSIWRIIYRNPDILSRLMRNWIHLRAHLKTCCLKMPADFRGRKTQKTKEYYCILRLFAGFMAGKASGRFGLWGF